MGILILTITLLAIIVISVKLINEKRKNSIRIENKTTNSIQRNKNRILKKNVSLWRKAPIGFLIVGVVFIIVSIAFGIYIQNQSDVNDKSTAISINQAQQSETYEYQNQRSDNFALTEPYSEIYKGYQIWRNRANDRFYIGFYGKSFESVEEAEKIIDSIYNQQQEYLKILQEQIDELNKELTVLQSKSATTLKSPQKLEKQYIKYFEQNDTNRNGELDWGEIKQFQALLSKNFSYENNDRVLTPGEFYSKKSGDCDDFSSFSASFIKYYGYPCYILTYNNHEDSYNGHAVAAIYIGDELYEEGSESITNKKLYSPKENGELDELAPNGNYVILDYWKVGGTIDKYDYLEHVSKLEDVIGSNW